MAAADTSVSFVRQKKGEQAGGCEGVVFNLNCLSVMCLFLPTSKQANKQILHALFVQKAQRELNKISN